jgi:NADP-dependent 3-hydroxy acid dehydrogenase YdfG
VHKLAAQGYEVVAIARRIDRLNELAHSQTNVEPFACDVTDQRQLDSLVDYLSGRSLSLIIANAGGAFDSDSVVNGDVESWRKSFEVNVIGTLQTVKSLLPLMNGRNDAQIITTTSTAAYLAYEGGGSYVAAKHAEHALVATLRLELAGKPIRISEIAPGMVKTGEFALNRFNGDAAAAAKIYAGVEAPLTAEDVASAISWVASLPPHFNVDQMVIRPVAQAAAHKVHRAPLSWN